MSLGAYVQSVLLGLDRSERMRAARVVPSAPMDEHEPTSMREID